MRRLIAAVIANNVLANVVLVAVIVVGILAAKSMVREEMPEVETNQVHVHVPFPGAAPEEVMEGISQRIEAAVDGLPGVEQYHTTSYEGGASATIEVAPGYDVNEMKDRIEEAIDGIPSFPAEAETPRVSVVRWDEEVINLALWGDLPERQLKELAEHLRAELQRLADVSLVYVYGTRPYGIDIEVSKERLLEYGLTIADVSDAIRNSTLSLSSGAIRAEGEEIKVRARERRFTGDEFASVVVKASAQGERVTLGQIATIRDGFAGNPAYGTFNGHRAVLLVIEKAVGEDAIKISQAVRAFAEKQQELLPEGVHLSPCFDDSEFITGQINMLLRNGAMGLVLVLVILWAFLNTRLSFWVAMGIPISISGALILMWLSGASINQVTLFTFIIVLGIIVDDAIVVGEAIYVHRAQGKPPLDAAVDGVCEVGLPVIGAVTTTIAAFLPLAFVSGDVGMIMSIMPVVVISALAVSLLECLFLLPAHLNHLPLPSTSDAGRRRGWDRWRNAAGDGMMWFAEHVYAPCVGLAVRHRYASLCVAIGILMVAVGIYEGGHVRVVFWPPIDGNHVRGFVEFPVGTRSETTREAIDRTREAIERVAARTETSSGKPLIRNTFAYVFQGSPHMGHVSVELLNPSERGVHSQDLAVAWEKETGVIPGAVRQSFSKDDIDVGSGAEIEVWLQGNEMRDLVEAASHVQEKLRTYDGVFQVSSTYRPGKTELQIKLKEEARALGLTLEDLARYLHVGYYGAEPVRFQRGRDDVRVRVRYPESERRTLAELERIRVTTPQGHQVPLMSVADVETGQGYSSISSSNGLCRIVVWASVDKSRTSPEAILADLGKGTLDTMLADLPGVAWSFRGQAEDHARTASGLSRGFLIALLGIFVIMATIFRSYAQPFLILLVIPFGIVGAIVGHLLLGIPLTLLSLFGIVALAGIAVNDAIVLIECINQLVADGTPFYEALAKGGVRRFRAVLLTSATTCAGLTPLLLERDLQAQIVIPLAVSLVFGVVFTTFVTLLFLPCLLGAFNDLRRAAFWLAHKRWPTPEEVEPARTRAHTSDAHDSAVLGREAIVAK